MNATTMKSLVDLVEEAGREVEKNKGAYEERIAAGVAFLTSLVDVLTPVLPAMSSRVPRKANGWLRQFDQDGPHVKYYGEESDDPLRGVLLIGDTRPTVDPNPAIPFQRLKHEALWISNGGRFFLLSYAGEYNRHADTFQWLTSIEELNFRRVVTEKWPLGEIAAALVEELEATAKGAKKTTPKLDDQARKLRACATLLNRKDLRADVVEAIIKLGAGS